MEAKEIDIDALLFECVEKGLDHYGSTFRFVIYHELALNYKLERNVIVRKPLVFSDCLERMFGEGAISIKRTIVRELGERFSLSTEQEDLVSMINKTRAHLGHGQLHQ